MQKWTRAQGTRSRRKRVQLGAQLGGWGASWRTPLACGPPPMWMFTCHCAGWAGGLKEAAVRRGQTLPSSAAWPGSCSLGGRVPTGQGSQALCLLALVPCPDHRAALPLPALSPHPPSHGRGSLNPHLVVGTKLSFLFQVCQEPPRPLWCPVCAPVLLRAWGPAGVRRTPASRRDPLGLWRYILGSVPLVLGGVHGRSPHQPLHG